MTPPEHLQLFCMPILHCGPPVTVLSPHKKHHMGHHEITGGSNKTKKELDGKQNMKNPEKQLQFYL